MKVKYNIEKMRAILYDFNHITGLRITVLDSNFNLIAEVPNDVCQFCSLIQKFDNCKGCQDSDAKLLSECQKTMSIAINVCHSGLLNAALPIILLDEVIGYVIMGQVRESLSFDSILNKIPSTLATPAFIETYYDLAYCTRSQLESGARTVAMLTISIIAEEFIKFETEELAERAAIYIQDNLCDDLSINFLCSQLNTSKNILYKNFKSKYNCTVNEYISQCRISSAKKLLSEKPYSIREVGEKVGIADESYFCRFFKSHVGCTPLQYRKNNS